MRDENVRVREKFELVRVRPKDQVTDKLVRVIGPDIAAMEEGKKYPFGILIEIAGSQLEPDIEGVIESIIDALRPDEPRTPL